LSIIVLFSCNFSFFDASCLLKDKLYETEIFPSIVCTVHDENSTCPTNFSCTEKQIQLMDSFLSYVLWLLMLTQSQRICVF